MLNSAIPCYANKCISQQPMDRSNVFSTLQVRFLSPIHSTYSRYSTGYLHIPNGSDVSVPKTSGSLPLEKAPIPRKDLLQLREALRSWYPDLADRQIAWTRICYYTDSANRDFLIAKHPKFDNVHYATAGSGHGFKVRRRYCICCAAYTLRSSCRSLEHM